MMETPDRIVAWSRFVPDVSLNQALQYNPQEGRLVLLNGSSDPEIHRVAWEALQGFLGNLYHSYSTEVFERTWSNRATELTRKECDCVKEWAEGWWGSWYPEGDVEETLCLRKEGSPESHCPSPDDELSHEWRRETMFFDDPGEE